MKSTAEISMPPELSTIQRLEMAIYQLHARVHWPPRAAAVLSAIEALSPSAADRGNMRVVDLGCAHAPLTPLVAELGYSYLGIDLTPGFVEYAARTYAQLPHVQYKYANASEFAAGLDRSDIVVLNAIVHHLSDADWVLLKQYLPQAYAFIILDYYRISFDFELLWRPTHLAQWLLQKLDRGNFFRDESEFKTIGGLTPVRTTSGLVYFLGVPMWNYFCSTYLPHSAK